MAKTRKVGAAGRFRVGYGKSVRERILKIEQKQRKKQICPYCKKKTAKRLAKGLWLCKSCNKKFTGEAYWVE
jgi:large subunit ribosomal protein L37Ae